MIYEVSDIVGLIAAAIEEQAVSTKDIAWNVAEASIGVTEANERIAQSSEVSKEIAKDISTLDHTANGDRRWQRPRALERQGVVQRFLGAYADGVRCRFGLTPSNRFGLQRRVREKFGLGGARPIRSVPECS